MKLSVLLLLFTVLLLSACTESLNCNMVDIKTIFFYSSQRNGVDNYVHYVLVEDFPRECLDSTKIVQSALYYADTIKKGKPIKMIKIFNSDKDFIPNEISQVANEINKSCLVTITFNLDSMSPCSFIFYDYEGEVTYGGNKWLPSGPKDETYYFENCR